MGFAGGGGTEGGMEANGSLVAGSHNRNELVVIRQDGDGVNGSQYSHILAFFHVYRNPTCFALDFGEEVVSSGHARKQRIEALKCECEPNGEGEEGGGG